MSLKTSCLNCKTYLQEQTFNIWLRLVGLTLLSAAIAEFGNMTILTTLMVSCIVILKGGWVIDHFMGLKTASRLTRWIVKGYFYAMTCIVGVTVTYSQLVFPA